MKAAVGLDLNLSNPDPGPSPKSSVVAADLKFSSHPGPDRAVDLDPGIFLQASWVS